MMIVGPVNVSWHMPTPVWQGLHLAILPTMHTPESCCC